MTRIVRGRGTALLWITHDPATLVGFADRIAVMNAGKIVEYGNTNEIFRKPMHSYTQQLVSFSKELVAVSPLRTSANGYAN